MSESLTAYGRAFEFDPKPNTLIVGSDAARVLFGVDYEAVELRALALQMDMETAWPRRSSDDPVKACTRLMEMTPEWDEFERRVEGPIFREYKLDSWHHLYESLLVKVAEADRDPPGTRKRWTPMPHQTTGAEALDLWKTTAGHFG